MLKLPSYQDVANVAPARDPGVTAPISAFQSGAGAFAGELAPGIGAVAAVLREEERRIDNAAGNDFRRRLLELETEKDEWLAQQKGENVFDAKAKLDKDIDARVAKIKEGLKNDRQRNLAKEIEGDWRVGVNRKSSRYIAAEMDNHYDSVDSKLVESSSRAAQKAAGTGDFDRVQQEWEDQEKVIAGLAERKGLSPVQRKDMLDDRKSEFHSGIVLQLMADDNDMLATDYFMANKSEIDTKSQFTLGKQLEVANTRAAAQTLADKYMAKHNDNFGLAVEEARKIKNPKVREATLNNIRQAKSDNEAAAKLDEDNAFTAALQTVQSTGNVAKIKPSDWVRVGPDGHAALEKMASEVKEKRTPTTDQKVWNEFNSKSTDRMWLAVLTEKEFTSYLMDFDDQKRDRASALRDAAVQAAKGDAKSKDFLRNDATLRQLVLTKVIDAGLIDAKKKTADYTQEDETILNNTVAEASSQLERLQVENKRKATVDEERSIVNGLLMKHVKVKVEKPWYQFDSTKKISELTGEEIGKAYVPYKSVPIVNRDSIRKMGVELGVKTEDLSEDRIAKAYTVFVTTKGLPRADREARIAAILRGQ
jgi:hypothetical protein